MSDIQTNAEWFRDEAKRKQRCIREMRAIAGDLYSERGEDQRTAEMCRQMIRIAAEEGE